VGYPPAFASQGASHLMTRPSASPLGRAAREGLALPVAVRRFSAARLLDRAWKQVDKPALDRARWSCLLARHSRSSFARLSTRAAGFLFICGRMCVRQERVRGRRSSG